MLARRIWRSSIEPSARRLLKTAGIDEEKAGADPMLLEYEKEMLGRLGEESSLVIAAAGLSIARPLAALIPLYANERSLLILLNATERDLFCLNSADQEFVVDVSALSIAQRHSAYTKGGVFYGSSRSFITDFVNGNIDVKSISAVFVLNAERAGEDGIEAFILHIFRQRNSLALVHAFVASPLLLHSTKLHKLRAHLHTASVLLYPRFQQSVINSLGSARITKIYSRQSSTVSDLSLLIADIVQGIYRTNNWRAERATAAQVLNLHADRGELKKFKTLLKMLYNCDSLCFYTFYRSMFEAQIALGAQNSWVFSAASQALLDRARDYLRADIRAIMPLPGAGIPDCDSTRSGTSSMSSDELPGADQEEDANSGGDIENLYTQLASEMGEDSDGLAASSESTFGDAIEEVANSSDSAEEPNAQRSPPANSKAVPVSPINPLSHHQLQDFGCRNAKLKRLAMLLKEHGRKRLGCVVDNGCVANSLRKFLRSVAPRASTTVLRPRELGSSACVFDALILLYPTLSAIRASECYTARVTGCELFLLIYKDSVEEQMYLTELQSENSLFNRLIEEKAALPLSCGLGTLDAYGDESVRYQITVDSREMRARLPYYLYLAGNDLAIKTLSIGDYLVGRICVERKSIEDLKGSLNTGRLYSQARRLAFLYASPVLLLEFDDGVPSLQLYEQANSLAGSLITKFCLFLANFGSFRLIWSNSPLASVQAMHDIQKTIAEDSAVSDVTDPTLYELLLSIPGINSFNVRKAVKEFDSLEDLITAPSVRLEAALGRKAGQEAYAFFKQR